MMNPNRNTAQCSFSPRPDALQSCFWLLRFLRSFPVTEKSASLYFEDVCLLDQIFKMSWCTFMPL